MVICNVETNRKTVSYLPSFPLIRNLPNQKFGIDKNDIPDLARVSGIFNNF